MPDQKDLFNRTCVGQWNTVGDDLQYRFEEGSDGVLELHFQGSVSGRDWKNNFAFAARPYKKMPVPWRAHRGFVRLYKSGRDAIMADFALRPAPKALRIVGYSQGAALAILAHEDFMFTFPGLEVSTVAFAPPRVLWLPRKTIRSRFTGLTSIRRRGDIVTLIPPWSWGYRHSGVQVKIGKPALPWWTHHLQDEYSEAL